MEQQYTQINSNMFEDPQSSDEELPVPDADSCDSQELQRLFRINVQPSCEIATSLKRTCGLKLSLSCDASKVAVGLSRKQLQIYNSSNGALTINNDNFAKYNSTIKGVKFFNNDPNLLMLCTEEGTVTMYDLRSGNKTVHTFDDCSEGSKKTMTGFDINQNDRILCASTDVQKSGDSFLLFFDIRERKYLGCYWECHSEDITHVKFHPKNPDLLTSGSVDGLINVFDISESTEDDAMQYCMNVENPIEALNWHSSPTDADWISCITTTNDFHLYDVETQDPVVTFDRQAITQCVKRTSSIDCNVINAFNDADGKLFLLAGSNYNKGECLRSLQYQHDNKCFLPHGNYLHNKQIVRSSVYNEKENCLITTGESGLVTVWRCEAADPQCEEYEISASKSLKQKLHVSKRTKPY